MLTPYPDPMLPRPYRVRRVRRETHDVFTLELTPEHDDGPMTFAAGQCNMLYMFGMGEVPISISGNPLRPQPLVHTIRAVGTVTSAMRTLKRGAVLGVRGPFGTPWPVSEAMEKDVVLLAGGLGLAPLRPVVYFLLAHRPKYGRVMLLYGTRTPEDILFRRELEQWRARLDIDVMVTVDRATSAWRGNVGGVTKLIARAAFDPPETMVLLCGPEVMMRFALRDFLQRGVQADHLFVSMERNMKCAIGLCGHCQFGPTFVCKDGPVMRYDRIASWFGKREL